MGGLSHVSLPIRVGSACHEQATARRMDRHVTEEQRSRRPIFIATLRAARLLAGCFVAHRSKTTAGILPLRFAHPVKIRSSAATPVTDLVH